MQTHERLDVEHRQPTLATDHVTLRVRDVEQLLESLDRDEYAWDSRMIAAVERVEHALTTQEERRGR